MFKDFPHSHLIYPILNLGENIKCTCTIIWLLSYDKIYFGIENRQYTIDLIGTYLQVNESFNLSARDCLSKIDECQMEEKLRKCVEIKNANIRFDIFIGDL